MPQPSKSLSELLDEALSLPTAQRLAWVDTLGPEHEAHRERLRAMLTRAVQSERLLGTLPKLDTTGAEELARFTDGAHVERERVGPYTLIRKLGVGGMGTVWLARGAHPGAPDVALKLAHLAPKRGDLRARLSRERELLAKLDHPNIARVLDGGVTEHGQPYLVLEHVRGVALDAYRRAQPLPLMDRLALFLQIATAVAHAHDRAIVHRDLKPANVMVREDGTACLLDFGVGKLLTDGVPEELQLSVLDGRPHTPAYAAPEQLVGHDVHFEADVYALGVILYELLTGARPYQRFESSAFNLCWAIIHELPVVPSEHPMGGELASLAPARRMALDFLVLKALAKRAPDRHASAREIATAVHRVLH